MREPSFLHGPLDVTTTVDSRPGQRSGRKQGETAERATAVYGAYGWPRLVRWLAARAQPVFSCAIYVSFDNVKVGFPLILPPRHDQ